MRADLADRMNRDWNFRERLIETACLPPIHFTQASLKVKCKGRFTQQSEPRNVLNINSMERIGCRIIIHFIRIRYDFLDVSMILEMSLR